MPNRTPCPRFLLAWLLPALALTACGDGGTPGSQVAARVNGQEIAFRAEGGEAPDDAALQALDKLIDQALLVQRAVEKRLDRDPDVLRQIDEARRRILAQKHVERNMTAPAATTAEIHAFYRAHPAQFEHRQLFRIEELATPADAEATTAIRARIGRSDSLDDIANWLLAAHRPLKRGASQRTGDQMGAPLLRRLQAMKPGEMALAETAGVLVVTRLVEVRPVPLTLAEATPVIDELLAEQKLQELAGTMARQLRMQARIEYLGPFAEARKNAEATPLRKVSNDDSHLKKGLSGVL